MLRFFISALMTMLMSGAVAAEQFSGTIEKVVPGTSIVISGNSYQLGVRAKVFFVDHPEQGVSAAHLQEGMTIRYDLEYPSSGTRVHQITISGPQSMMTVRSE